jgi:hypothetical protein
VSAIALHGDAQATAAERRNKQLRVACLLLAHRDLASRIDVRNAAESEQTRIDANDPSRPFRGIAAILPEFE